MSASSLNESHHDPPTRTKSEGDTIDSLSQDNHSQRRPTIPHVNSFTFGQKKKKFFGGRNTKKQWMFAAQKAKSLRDPWGGLGMESLAEEVVTRHMYNPRSKKWKVDEIVVKIQSEVSVTCSIYLSLSQCCCILYCIRPTSTISPPSILHSKCYK